MSDDRQSSVHPFVQAQRMEQAALAERLANALRDADLAAMDLPPEALALISGGCLTSWTKAQQVAAAVAGAMERAGVIEAATVWFDAMERKHGARAWMQHERAGRALGRRVAEAMIAETEATDGE